MDKVDPTAEERIYVVADERIADTVKRSGYQLTNAEASAQIADREVFVGGVLSELAKLREESGETVDEKAD